MQNDCISLENYCNVLPFESYHTRKIKRLLALPPEGFPLVRAKPTGCCTFDFIIKERKIYDPGFGPEQVYITDVPRHLLAFAGHTCIWCPSGLLAVLDSKRFFEPLVGMSG